MIVLLLLFTGPALFAQDGSVLPLSLRKSIEIALAPEGNTRMEIARELIDQADARRREARASLLPNLDSSVSYQDATKNLRAFGIQFPSVPGLAFSTFAGPFAIFDARSNATQTVFDFSAIRRYQSARDTVETVRRERDSVRSSVTDQVARAYLTALRAEARVAAAKSNVELAEALRKLAESQKRAGTGTGIEVVRAEVETANEKQALQVADNERNRAHLQLLKALDLRLDTKLELTDHLEYSAVEPVSISQAIETAVKERPDYRAQEQREHAAHLSLDSVKYERLPSISAFGDYGTIGPGIDDSRATRTIGVSLRVPIFDGGRRDARRAESASELRQEKIRTRDLREQLELEIRLAFENLQSAEAQVRTSQEGLDLAQQELEQAQRRYKAGVANSVEIVDAQTRLVRARDNRIAALFQHNLARLDLGTAMGVVERFLP